jgi:hypothetical protein
VSLTVTPFVGLESMELVVSVEVGDLTGIAPNGTPIIGTRTLDTTVRLMDGQEYVVAHLKRTNNIEEAAKAPFFGDIPVLGYLFGGETQTNRESDLLVVITPHFHLSSQTDLGLTADAQSTKDIVVGDASYSAPDRVPSATTSGCSAWKLRGWNNPAGYQPCLTRARPEGNLRPGFFFGEEGGLRHRAWRRAVAAPCWRPVRRVDQGEASDGRHGIAGAQRPEAIRHGRGGCGCGGA